MMMGDGEIRLSTGATVACVLWGVVLALFVAAWSFGDWRLAIATIVTGQLAGVATVRAFLVGFAKVLRNGFDLGQDSVSMLRR